MCIDDYAYLFQVWTAGQVIGLIHDIPTCKELVTRIEREAAETLQKNAALVIDDDDIPKTATGTVSKHDNNPQAQLWGIGEKSKL